MGKFKQFLKQLGEDKLLTKEDEGGCPVGGGEVVSTGCDSTTTSDVQTANPSIDTGLKTTDIFGKCDHKKDGFLGPGCYHIPYQVFSYPISRIKRKKNKNIKVIDLTESEDFVLFD